MSSETGAEIDEASASFEAPVEHERSFELDERTEEEGGQKGTEGQGQAEKDNYRFKSVQEAVKGLDDGRQWERIGGSSGGDYMAKERDRIYHEEADGKETVLFNLEQHREIINALSTQGFFVHEQLDTETNQLTRGVYFANDKGEMSYEIFALSSEEKQSGEVNNDESEVSLFDSSVEDQGNGIVDGQEDSRSGFFTEPAYAVAVASAEVAATNADSDHESSPTVVSVETVATLSIESPQQSTVEHVTSDGVEVIEIVHQEFQDSAEASIIATYDESQGVAEAISEQQVIVEAQRDIQEFGIALVQETKVVAEKIEIVQSSQSVEVAAVSTEAAQAVEVSAQSYEIAERENGAEEGIVLVEMSGTEETSERIAIERVEAVEVSTIVDAPEMKATVAPEQTIVPAAAVSTRVEVQSSMLTVSETEKNLGIELDVVNSDETPVVTANEVAAQPVRAEASQETIVVSVVTSEVESATVVVATETVLTEAQGQAEVAAEVSQIESPIVLAEADVEVTEDVIEQPEVVSEQIVERVVAIEQPIEIISNTETVVKAEVRTEVVESTVVESRAVAEKVVAETVIEQQETTEVRINLAEVVAQNEAQEPVVLFRRESEPAQDQSRVVEFSRGYRNEVARSVQETFRSQQNSSTTDTNVIEEEAELEPQAISLAA